ncbi:probable 1-acyl-sn-glycerol-3-phosphate acyltransferase 5 [Magnolia sinica]|uniref:probable 1-acyl-sn-glycerol-3-phosphate acyltransferase 5 n=1 Tax=Magnolia sinica TaxID=86752 RepID=UPI00265B06F7|nr:probable 1-acyl-sn-glycerol-3-phosphate acyltransferase 5 [Magnolia sinica]XP_058080593.1 probable 1-acyl-sn-glycerol-3-phosphate acyltransferase 5 [Magnolia sinica]
MNGSAASEGDGSNKYRNPTEVCNLPNSSDGPRHRPLTPLRVLRGVLCLVVLLSTAFMTLVYWAPMTAVMLRLFSIRYSRRATSILFGTWLALWPFLFEKINQTKVVFAGETVPERERVLLLANHRTEVDWMYLWDLALRKGRLGYIKYILKSSLMKLPIFGWGFHILEFISVERKWKIDEPMMHRMLSTFVDPRDPLWLAVFPEGTDFTEEKCIRSQKFQAENGLPILKNVLCPKTKGFHACVEALRNSLDAVYDVTIGYKHRCPHFMDNVFGVDPSEVHLHIRRIPLKDIPTSENEAAAWLMEAFRLKDQLLSNFTTKGHFPDQGTEGDLSTLKCLVNVVVVIALTSICTYVTIFSSVWFKIYVALSCVYLATATYFNLRPSPILGSVKSLFCGKKFN